jgi:hypothetical protein
MANMKEIAKIFAILGGLVGLLEGILMALSLPAFFGFGLLGGALGIVQGIIVIVLALIVLASSGIVDIPVLKFDANWILFLILGIVMIVLDAFFGGILTLLSGILLLIK